MGKSDDSIARRKNKKTNSKNQQKVSSRVSALIAAKKRRKSGKRRNCQGMCFSLPTPENPFNDELQKTHSEKKKPLRPKADKMRKDKKLISAIKDSLNNNLVNVDDHKRVSGKHKLKTEPMSAVVHKIRRHTVKLPKEIGDNNTPSKFLMCCLNSIQNALLDEKLSNRENDSPLFAHKWGVEFWKLYSSGRDILECSQVDSDLEKIAWVASCAADTIARKEDEGLSFECPFLLYIFPSQEKTAKARQICKPLKTSGIHSVSLHSGASIDHQVQGLKSVGPEFLFSTPARLVELLALKAVEISGVSLLVIDGCEAHPENDFADSVKLIRKSISSNAQTVIFNGCSSLLSLPDIDLLLQDPIRILPADDKRYPECMEF